MSADNWTWCPRCYADKSAAHDKAILKVGKAYGKVSPEEYLAMNTEANNPVDHEETLREDYGIGTDADGIFTVNYSCSCKCGYSFGFKHSEQVKFKP